MESEQAHEAVQPIQAAPVAGVENARERTMCSLLKEMAGQTGEKCREGQESELHAESPAGLGPNQGAGSPEGGSMSLRPGEEPESGVAESGVGLAEGAEESEQPGQVSADGEEDFPNEADGKKARNFRGRWDHLNEQERRVVELATKRGLALGEAYRAVYGDTELPSTTLSAPGEGSSSNAEQAAASEVVEMDKQIALQQQRLEELRQQKTDARRDMAEYDKAAEAYMEARETLRELRGERRRVAEVEAERALKARQQAVVIAQEALMEEYPDALTPGTELHDACREELAYLRESNSPLFRDPQVEYKVARRLARALGFHRAAPQAASQAVTAPAAAAVPPQRRTVRPVPVGGSPVEAPVATLERRVAGARSPGAMLDLMREIGTPFEALLKKG